jgi:hypothetical protein
VPCWICDWQGAGDAIEAYVREKISLSTVFVLVERANMEAILSEIELGLSGMVDPSNSAKAGELLGAELLVQGSLSESGANLVLSPLVVAPTLEDRSVRYTVFSGSGISLGATAIYSPTPRINLGLSANGFMLVSPKMTHWFMDFLNYDIVDGGAVAPVNRDIVIEGSKFSPSFGVFGKTRFEYLISRRMSLGLEGGYLWMPPFIPDKYVTGNHIQASNTADAFPTYMDKNGTFDFMGLFNVARVDGTTGSALMEFNPSSVYATLYLAVHF